MSSAIGKHMKAIREQREILRDFQPYAAQLDRYWERTSTGILYDFETMAALHHYEIDVAESRLKVPVRRRPSVLTC